MQWQSRSIFLLWPSVRSARVFSRGWTSAKIYAKVDSLRQFCAGNADLAEDKREGVTRVRADSEEESSTLNRSRYNTALRKINETRESEIRRLIETRLDTRCDVKVIITRDNIQRCCPKKESKAGKGTREGSLRRKTRKEAAVKPREERRLSGRSQFRGNGIRDG